MPIALDPKRTERYILAAEREQTNPTVFLLRALTHRQRAEVEDAAFAHMSTGAVEARIGMVRHMRLQRGLVGWERFFDVLGEPVTFVAERGGGAAAVSLDMLDGATTAELSDAIHALSTLTNAEGN